MLPLQAQSHSGSWGNEAYENVSLKDKAFLKTVVLQETSTHCVK